MAFCTGPCIAKIVGDIALPVSFLIGSQIVSGTLGPFATCTFYFPCCGTGMVTVACTSCTDIHTVYSYFKAYRYFVIFINFMVCSFDICCTGFCTGYTVIICSPTLVFGKNIYSCLA
jgi:hypothetical protein